MYGGIVCKQDKQARPMTQVLLDPTLIVALLSSTYPADDVRIELSHNKSHNILVDGFRAALAPRQASPSY